MFDWVLNTPLPLDGYYLHSLSRSMYIFVVSEYFEDVASRLQYS